MTDFEKMTALTFLPEVLRYRGDYPEIYANLLREQHALEQEIENAEEVLRRLTSRLGNVNSTLIALAFRVPNDPTEENVKDLLLNPNFWIGPRAILAAVDLDADPNDDIPRDPRFDLLAEDDFLFSSS